MEAELFDLKQAIPGEPIPVEAETYVETDNSVWLIRPDVYYRCPKTEGPRDYHDAAEWSDALIDGVWHEYELAEWLHDPWSRQEDNERPRIRIMPTGRDIDAFGIVTGYVVSVIVRR